MSTDFKVLVDFNHYGEGLFEFFPFGIAFVVGMLGWVHLEKERALRNKINGDIKKVDNFAARFYICLLIVFILLTSISFILR
jgi:hypothetical protein